MIEANPNVRLGLLDDVDKCRQPTLTFNFEQENLAIFGNKFSGKTTLLKHLVLELHSNQNANERILILDFSNDLSEYKSLPLVYGYFPGENEESIKRCLGEVEKALSQNKVKTKTNRSHYTFIVDGVDDLFLEGKYERHQETFASIAKKGLDSGITVVFTSYHSSSSIIRLLQFFKKVVAFDLPAEKYEDLFPRKVEKPMVIQGRGIANQGDATYEFQAYFPFENKESCAENEKTMLTTILEKTFTYDLKNIRKKSFSNELTENELRQLFPSLDMKDFIVGVDYTTFDLVSFDVHKAGVIALYGTNFNDKLTIIKRIIQHTNASRILLWDDSRARIVEALSKVSFENIKTKDKFGGLLFSNYPKRETLSDDQEDQFTLLRFLGLTIFIIQNARFFSDPVGCKYPQLALQMCRTILQQASDMNLLFIFTNVAKISPSSELREYFNPCIKHAFLCGDIFHFIETKGRSSVFGELDPYELKQDFSRTTSGDGFYMDDESDYPQKIKFVIPNDDGGN